MHAPLIHAAFNAAISLCFAARLAWVRVRVTVGVRNLVSISARCTYHWGQGLG